VATKPPYLATGRGKILASARKGKRKYRGVDPSRRGGGGRGKIFKTVPQPFVGVLFEQAMNTEKRSSRRFSGGGTSRKTFPVGDVREWTRRERGGGDRSLRGARTQARKGKKGARKNGDSLFFKGRGLIRGWGKGLLGNGGELSLHKKLFGRFGRRGGPTSKRITLPLAFFS